MLLSALDIRISVESGDRVFARLFHSRYSAFLTAPTADRATLRYAYRSDGAGLGSVLDPQGNAHPVRDSSHATDRLDDEIVIALQRLRDDLLFLHAAALERNGSACLLAADSGVGKSTTAWGLLHHGFSYASDELAAVDAQSRVHPYPRALSLKRMPPARYPAPAGAVRVGASMHLSPEMLPSGLVEGARPIAALFVLERSEHAPDPRLRAIGAAEAAASVYPMVLNALAHPDRGLLPVLRLVRAVPCYRLTLGALDRSCLLIRDAFDALAPTVRTHGATRARGGPPEGRLPPGRIIPG